MLSSAYKLEIISSLNILEFDSLFSDAHCPVRLDLRIHTHHDKRTTHNPALYSEAEAKL